MWLFDTICCFRFRFQFSSLVWQWSLIGLLPHTLRLNRLLIGQNNGYKGVYLITYGVLGYLFGFIIFVSGFLVIFSFCSNRSSRCHSACLSVCVSVQHKLAQRSQSSSLLFQLWEVLDAIRGAKSKKCMFLNSKYQAL